MPAPLLIELTEEERIEFNRLCRSGKTEARLKERLSIVLLADEGLTNGEIAQQLPVSARKASRWRKRFYENGLDGIRKICPADGVSLDQGIHLIARCENGLSKRPQRRSRRMLRIGVPGAWLKRWAPTLCLFRVLGVNMG